MRWGCLVFAALAVGLIEFPPHVHEDAFFAFFAVIMFGIFMDRCLERHRP
jgi:hypothetical protein